MILWLRLKSRKDYAVTVIVGFISPGSRVPVRRLRNIGKKYDISDNRNTLKNDERG